MSHTNTSLWGLQILANRKKKVAEQPQLQAQPQNMIYCKQQWIFGIETLYCASFKPCHLCRQAENISSTMSSSTKVHSTSRIGDETCSRPDLDERRDDTREVSSWTMEAAIGGWWLKVEAANVAPVETSKTTHVKKQRWLLVIFITKPTSEQNPWN